MTGRGPRRLVHRGVVDARAVAVSVESAEARRRVIALWSPRAKVILTRDAMLVLWPAPRRMDCARAPGAVLVALGNVLVAAPWTLQEIAALGAPEGSCVMLVGDRADVVDVREGAVDPSRWIDLEDYAVSAPDSLGEPPPAVVVVESRGVREVLTGQRTAARPEWREIVSALGAKLDGSIRSVGKIDDSEIFSPGEAPPTVPGWLSRAILALSAWFAAARARQRPPAEVSVRPALGLRTHWLDRVGRWLDSAAESLRLQAGLRSLLGARNAAFLESLIAKLEGGDVEGALFEAIPLGGAGGEEGEIAWRLPTRRDGLNITLGGGGGGGSFMPVGESLHERLRRIYRETAERLAASGKIEQAVFVLAELLGDAAGAVDLLVRHQRFVMAAELAEAASLDPSLIARLYMQARMPDEALRVVRIARCFETCAQSLASDVALRTELSSRWAEHLFAVGDGFEASRVAVAAPALRELSRAWLVKAAQTDGARRVEALAALRTRHATDFEAAAEIARALVERQGAIGREDRLAWARALTSGMRSFEDLALGRALLPALLRDGGDNVSPELSQRTDAMVTFVGDLAARADLPTRAVRAVAAVSVVVRAVAVGDVGARRVFDAAALPEGGAAAALGENGVAVFDREGALRKTFPVAAHALVAPTRGAVVIALARRAGAFVATKIDLADGAVTALGEVALESWSREHDGDAWVIAQSGRLVAVDVLASEITALRASRRLGGKVLRVAVLGTQCAAVVQGARALELMGCTAPRMTGLHRRPMPAAAEHGRWAITAGERVVASLPKSETSAGPMLLLDRDGREAGFMAPSGGRTVRELALTESLTAVFAVEKGSATVRLLDVSRVAAPGVGQAAVAAASVVPLLLWGADLGGANDGGVRLSADSLTAWDDLGRVFCWQLSTRTLRLDARV